MQTTRILLAAVLAVATNAVCAQTVSAPTAHSNTAGPISFSYDAQHNQIAANGVRFMASQSNINTVPLTGTIKVYIYVDDVTKFAKGTDIRCTALAVGGLLDTTNGVIAGALETVSGAATPTANGMYTCSLTIPYQWNLPPDAAADSGLILAVGVSALAGKSQDNGKGYSKGKADEEDSSSNAAGSVIRSTLQVGGVLALPPNGTTTHLNVQVIL